MYRKTTEQRTAETALSAKNMLMMEGTEEKQSRTLEIRLGKYLLVRSLGQGGEGSVYLAKDEHLQRFVAIKCIRRMKSERTEADRVETDKVETDRTEANRIEANRIEANRIEANRIEANSIEANRTETNRVEADRIEANEAEEDRLDADRLNAGEREEIMEVMYNGIESIDQECHEERAYEKKEEKIMREASYLQRLEHPMLPVVYDLFEDAEGIWYLVMEYIQGINLHEYIERNGCVQDGQARVWAKQLADVLGYLHSEKPPVIYADLKPDNIMVCPSGKLRLVDFGAALTRSFGADRRTVMAATPGYGAPEQWNVVNDISPDTGQGYMRSEFYADERSDIYALGKVLYYMVTGADPAKPPYTMLPIYEYQPLLGDDLEMIIRKCIRQAPDRRYQTVEEVKRDLCGGVRRKQRTRRKDFIRMVEKRVWLTEGSYKKSGYGY